MANCKAFYQSLELSYSSQSGASSLHSNVLLTVKVSAALRAVSVTSASFPCLHATSLPNGDFLAF